MFTPIFIAPLFTIAKIWKQPKCPWRDKWIKKNIYIYISHDGILKTNPASVPQHQIKSPKQRLGEVGKNSFIALPGKGGHGRLMLSKVCPNQGSRGSCEESCSPGTGLLIRIRVLPWPAFLQSRDHLVSGGDGQTVTSGMKSASSSSCFIK